MKSSDYWRGYIDGIKAGHKLAIDAVTCGAIFSEKIQHGKREVGK